MAFDKFNSAGGYSVAIPPIDVIDVNANVYGNYIAAANISSNTIYANAYYYANGSQIVGGSPAGLDTQVQFNSNGNFGASPQFTFDSTADLLTVSNLSISGLTDLGAVSNITISGGTAGYYLQTDGTGNLTWANVDQVDPSGVNTSVQFNDNGFFGGDNYFVYNKSTLTLTVPFIVANNISGNITGNITGNANYANFAGTVINSAQPNITSVGTLTSLSVSGTTTANYFIGNGAGLTSINGSNITGIVPLAYNVTNNNQPNITSVGVLSSLTVATDIDATNIQVVDKVTSANLAVSESAHFTGALIASGTVNAASASTVNLGPVANVKLSGGSANYYLQTDGTGNLNWTVGPGATTPGGSNSQVQYNNNGVFGGDPNFTYNPTSDTLTVSGNLIANTIQIGSGAYKTETILTGTATTNSTASNQLLHKVEAQDVAGVDYHIIATDAAGGSRNSAKISSVYLDGTVQFNEYAGLAINGFLGDYSVGYDPGDVINPATIQLKITPNTANNIVYKMTITVYSD